MGGQVKKSKNWLLSN